jgi:hypothetical protein
MNLKGFSCLAFFACVKTVAFVFIYHV